MATTVPSICRNCPALCPILVTVEDGRAVKVTGDPGVALFEGYSCPKGRALPEQHSDPGRLLKCLKRNADGGFAPIASGDALAEVTAKVQDILQQYGPRALAMYFGTGTLQNPCGVAIGASFFRAVKSRMIFSASAIDKPAAQIAMALHGNWVAGAQRFESSDTWMLVGANPVISKTSGIPSNNPGGRLKKAVKNGMKMIVIDPRRTETAKQAHVHLQARPGEDPALLAGILHIILEEGLYDRNFVAQNAHGLEQLKAALAGFTPDYVAQRAGVAVDDLLEAARTFGRAKRGGVACATGPSFSTHSNLAFYLAMCLNTVCGRWAREGDIATYQNVLLPAYTPKAQPYAPFPPQGEFEMRVGGLKETASGMPTAALADEILLEGEGRVRALFCLGSNPLMAWPDQQKAREAMEKLDLLVCFESQISATAAYADYIIASPMALEVPASTAFIESIRYLGVSRGFEDPWAQYTPKIVEPPAGSDVIDDREFFFRMAQRMGLQLDWINAYGSGQHMERPIAKMPLDMNRVPSVDELLEMFSTGSRIPLSDVKQHSHGKLYEELQVRVAPRDADCTAYLQLADPAMMQELAEARAQTDVAPLHDEYPLRLVCRRANNFMNSTGQTLDVLNRGKPYNPAYMNPDDMRALGVVNGALVKVRSARGEVEAIAESDATLRPGVVSMTHGYGSIDGKENPWITGSPVSLLIGMDEYDPITGIPRMSAIPIHVKPLAAPMSATPPGAGFAAAA